MNCTMEKALEWVGSMKGAERLVAELMLTTGARLDALLALRIRDLHPSRRRLTLYDEGRRIEVEVLEELAGDLHQQIQRMRWMYEQDMAKAGRGGWDRQQSGWRWMDMFLFADEGIPARRFLGSGLRPARHPADFVNALMVAARRAGIREPVHSHSLRHIHSQWRLAHGATIPDLHRNLGHTDVMTTWLYSQSLTRGLQFTGAAH
ncbi:MAG TPA: tyrosine-type recombinase/integrase [Kiritimatiellia bacterium]|nr:tyrosine-type recombinase/integrase [Kiritimatiellia bacterium]